MKEYPKYILCSNKYIGVFQYIDHGFPIYRFPGGDRIADDYEIEHGSNDRTEIEKKIKEV